MGSSVGSDYHGRKSNSKIDFPTDAVNYLEERIDFLTYCLPKLTTFILPLGNMACKVHEARVTTRDLERKLVKINKKRLDLVEEIRFSNRLSDYLFELSRYIHIIETYTYYLYIILILCIYIPCC
jgi:ATP:cob(I)alamin adenosyltransferase